MNELVFAIKNDKLVSIDDVEKGVQCGCICPCCGEKLVARKGTKNSHHFAHESGTDCDYGYETSLHRLAKEIMQELEYVVLPSVDIGKNMYGEINLYKPYKAKIQKIELEKKYNDIRPDILISINNKILAIEIYVTHKVDFEKIQKIKNDNLSMIEIDLKELLKDKEKNTPLNIKNILKQILLSDNDVRKYWVFNSKKYQYLKQFNLIKEVSFYLGNPIVKTCPNIKKCEWRECGFNAWYSVQNSCKDCMYFLEYDKIGSNLICSNNNISLGKNPNPNTSIPIITGYDKQPIISKCPGYIIYKKHLTPNLKDCIKCPCFLSGTETSINCLLNQ